MVRFPRRLCLTMALIIFASAGWAAEVGTVAAAAGTAEIGRAGTWTAAKPGVPVDRGDELRTGKPGRLRVVFQDDSVLTLTDDADVIVNEQVFDPDRGQVRSLMQLVKGRVDALVSDYYHGAGAAYEMKTKTAVAGVRGTDFIMQYDPLAELTEVVGVSGHVQVQSLLARGGPAVLITAGELTSVPAGQAPTSPKRLSEKMFRQHLEGIDFVGVGASGLGRSLLSGASVPQADRAATTVGPVAAGGVTDERVSHMRDVGSILHQPPVETGRLHIHF